MVVAHIPLSIFAPVAQGGLVPRGTRVDVFQQIYDVFLLLGTVVGIVVIGYMCWNAYKYRGDGASEEGTNTVDEDDGDRPQLGELPSGGGKGRKLFLSFGLSAVIVISLIIWTYGTLLFVEQPASAMEEEELEVDVTGYQFFWEFEYPNGHTTSNELRVPQGTRIRLNVTSADVFHNFGAPGLRVKTDAIPGQSSETWFIGDELGRYAANCYELCGPGHSQMQATIIVMEPDEYEQWYQNTSAS